MALRVSLSRLAAPTLATANFTRSSATTNCLRSLTTTHLLSSTRQYSSRGHDLPMALPMAFTDDRKSRSNKIRSHPMEWSLPVTIASSAALAEQARGYRSRYTGQKRKTPVVTREEPWQATGDVSFDKEAARERERQREAADRFQYEQQYAREEDVRQIDTLTQGAVSHLRKVYSTVGSTTAIMGGAAAVSMMTPLVTISPLWPSLLALVPAIAIYSGWGGVGSQRQLGLLAAFAGLSGMALAPMLKFASFLNPWLIPSALLLTGGMFAGMTALAMYSRQNSMIRFAGPASAAMLSLFVIGLGSIFVSPASALYPVLHNVWLYGGLGLFSVWIAIDTQSILADYEAGERDYVRHALNMVINLKTVFSHILRILIGFGQSD